MKRLLVLGATGSIGTTCLDAIRRSLAPDVKIVGLTASSSPALPGLGKEFNAPFQYISGYDRDALLRFIDMIRPDIILNAISGSAGLPATLTAAGCGISIALANKESVVMGGRFMLSEAERHNASIIPVDSEHSAIYHLLKGRTASRLIITASGGPLRDRTDLRGVTIEEALMHPTWRMGRKITIDSATLANKGLEVIEASLLFSMPPECIDVTIHRQSIVHSMIETEEGAVYALMSPPDMTLPIITAIVGEGNGACHLVGKLPFSSSFSLSFEKWDPVRFPLLSLAYEAARKGGGLRIAYTAADETAVNAFLSSRITFTDIAAVVERVMEDLPDYPEPSSFEEISEIAERATRTAEALC